MIDAVGLMLASGTARILAQNFDKTFELRCLRKRYKTRAQLIGKIDFELMPGCVLDPSSRGLRMAVREGNIGLDVINGRAVAQVRSQHVNDGALRRQLHMIKLYAGKTYRIGTERASRSEDAAPLDTAQARRTHGRCPLGRSTALILSR